jgi:hypothetical protein
MEYNHLVNQAFAKIFVVASCGAIALWSAVMVRRRALPVALGVYGLLLATLIVLWSSRWFGMLGQESRLETLG